MYICAKCGGSFEDTRSEEAAQEEARRYWPEGKIEDMAVVCDDCWEIIRPDRVTGFETIPHVYLPDLPAGAVWETVSEIHAHFMERADDEA